eukprot:CAMPEP_0173119542 /NCGR_PEP_ID=MMETSP1102-20130122/51863_1 /TAXON_ID=49646 /ORGANISM="Geminigera sp., Strain Caron Lab Isolate" /LENGTH=50 /DNA_ID=CAMNT_0014025199 /DNA_START=153 /DNA_END=305 /DNA_ORIENTATION=+
MSGWSYCAYGPHARAEASDNLKSQALASGSALTCLSVAIICVGCLVTAAL